MRKNVITKSITESVVNAFWMEGGQVFTKHIATLPYNITESAARTMVKRVTGNKNAGVNVEKTKAVYEIDASVFFEHARRVDDSAEE